MKKLIITDTQQISYDKLILINKMIFFVSFIDSIVAFSEFQKNIFSPPQSFRHSNPKRITLIPHPFA